MITTVRGRTLPGLPPRTRIIRELSLSTSGIFTSWVAMAFNRGFPIFEIYIYMNYNVIVVTMSGGIYCLPDSAIWDMESDTSADYLAA